MTRTRTSDFHTLIYSHTDLTFEPEEWCIRGSPHEPLLQVE